MRLSATRGRVSGSGGAVRSLLSRALSAIRRNGGTLIGIPDNFAGAYIDSTGTTPVTAVGDLVGLLTDRSYGAGNLGVELVTNQTVAGLPAGGGTRVYNLTANLASTFVANKAYLVRYRVTGYAGTGNVGLAGAAPAGVVQQSHTANGEYQSIQLPTASGAPLLFTSNTNTCNFVLLSVREVLGNHATQATTASKPLVSRVPKRLGPELVTSQDLTTWTSGGAFGNFSGSTATTTTVTASGALGSRYVRVPCLPNRTYRFSSTVANGTGTGQVSIAFGTSSNIYITASTAQLGVTSLVLTSPADAAFMEVIVRVTTTGTTATFTNLTAGEVLEWTNAISFDGSNDFLQTGITTGNEGWICAGVTQNAAATCYPFAAGGVSDTSAGANLRLINGTTPQIQLGDGVARQVVQSTVTPALGTPFVYSGGWNASTALVDVNGTEGSAARTRNPTATTQATIGQAAGGGFVLGTISAIIYTPVLPSAADRALIRKWVGSLQGQTL